MATWIWACQKRLLQKWAQNGQVNATLQWGHDLPVTQCLPKDIRWHYLPGSGPSDGLLNLNSSCVDAKCTWFSQLKRGWKPAVGCTKVLKLSADQGGCELQPARIAEAGGMDIHGCLIQGSRCKIGWGRTVGVITMYVCHGVGSFLLGLGHLFIQKLAETKNMGKGE